MSKELEYDGIFFLPEGDGEQLKFSFFTVNDKEYDREPIENTELGDKFHIAFFKEDGEGHAVFDEKFEAIFSHPTTYLEGFVGMNLYGCMIRKTKSSSEWFEKYLHGVQKDLQTFRQ